MKTGELAGPASSCIVDGAQPRTAAAAAFSENGGTKVQAPSLCNTSQTESLETSPEQASVSKLDAIETAGSILKILLTPDLSSVREASLSAREFLEMHHISEELLSACELALVEACNNAILYAADGERTQPAELYVLCEPTLLEFQIIDHTRGFEWPSRLELPEPDSEHGRGLFIIRSLMDETFYLRSTGQNRLIMRKDRKVQTGPTAVAVEELPIVPEGVHVVGPPPAPVGDMQHKLALSEQVITTITQELCDQIANARLQQEQLDNRLISHELEIARNIQQSLLPKAFPALSGYELAGFCRSARQVGGDFFDVLPLGEDLVLLVVADVMGKGVPAALFAATLRTLVRTTAEWTQRPSELLARINRLMFDELSSVDMFITAQLVLADMREKTLTVAAAGHCPLLLANQRGETAPISPEGMPLGIVPHIKFTEQIVSLEPFHCALLYTDGLTEARDPQGEWFGHERLVKWLQQSATSNQSANELSDSFLAELNGFQGSSALKDDQTFLILAQKPSSK